MVVLSYSPRPPLAATLRGTPIFATSWPLGRLLQRADASCCREGSTAPEWQLTPVNEDSP